ncbi:hypothetical protein [Pendulispora albinea]|uniref:Uncharacterized protein n=1 Tax=Pendulispora albinea TaxID=2741071 RepID=A0ABZ2M224_9BACT
MYLLLACAPFVALRAEAAPPEALRAPRVLLIAPRGDPLSERVRLELGARGFGVVRGEHFDPAHPAEGVNGLVLVVEGGGAGVAIWAVDDAREARLLSRVALHDAPATGAIRVAEVARTYAGAGDSPRNGDAARGADAARSVDAPSNVSPPGNVDAPGNVSPLGNVDSPSAGTSSTAARQDGADGRRASSNPAPASQAEPPGAKARGARSGAAARFDAFAEVTWMHPGAGFSSSLGANIGFRVYAHPRVAIGGFAGFPIASSSIRTEVGSARVSPYFLGGTVRVALLDERGPGFRMGVGAGVALQWVRTDGETRAPYEGRSSNVWGAMPLATIDLGHTLGDALVIHGAGIVGASVPKVDVRFANDTVGAWASPMIGLQLGLTIRAAERTPL